MDERPVPDPAATSPRHRALLGVAGVVAGVLVIAGAGALVLDRASSDARPVAAASTPSALGQATPGASAVPDATDPALAAPLPPARPVLVLGDSLGLDVYPWLADLLPDRYVSYAAVVGRSTPATLAALQALSDVPPVVLVSSGTNDQVANVLEESARRILDLLGPARCVVWADVVRPDSVGDPQDRMNAALQRAVEGRSSVRVLRWTDLVAAHPEWMSGDGIHPDTAGARARAEAFAAAARACSPLDPAAPRASRQYLPPSAFGGPLAGQGRSTGGSTPRATVTSSSSARAVGASSGTASPANPGTATSWTSPTTAPATSAATSGGTTAGTAGSAGSSPGRSGTASSGATPSGPSAGTVGSG